MTIRSEIVWLKEHFEEAQGVLENEYSGAGYPEQAQINDRKRAEAVFAKLLAPGTLR